MKLNYTMKSNGMYILCGRDFDDIATLVLTEYMPKVLEWPQPVNIDYLATECLPLDIRHEHISINGSILGMVANDPNNHTMGSEFTPYYLILMSQGGAFNLKNFYSMIDRHSFVIVSRKKQSHKINNSRYSFERRKKTVISTIMPIIAILYILIST